MDVLWSVIVAHPLLTSWMTAGTLVTSYQFCTNGPPWITWLGQTRLGYWLGTISMIVLVWPGFLWLYGRDWWKERAAKGQ